MRHSWTSGRLTILAAMLCAAVSGCCNIPSSGIDPTGQRIFAAPPAPIGANRANERYYDQPLGQLPWDDVAVELQPHETVAPVGSEVVLIAGVCGPDGYLRTNRRLEWTLDPSGVGQFVSVGENGLVDLMLGDFNRPRKLTNTFAIGSTSRANTRLNRGACSPESNVYVLRGQGWVSLTSAAEGTSNVTVFAPEVYRWDARLKSAMVHWVDAQWRLPPPAINPAGTKHVFTTTVMRQSNQTPCERWRVRYEIVGGPPAGFAPDGTQAVEVPTDPAGQASVEIFEKEPKHGTNQIRIQVIRPGDLPGANGQRLVVGTGTTMKTWTGADLAVKITGPATASPSATLSYQIDVCNPGDLAAKDVVATDVIPDGLTFLSSTPPPETTGRQLQWRLGEIGARQHRTIDLNFRADRPGSVSNCCEVVAAGGLRVANCATTTIAAAAPPVASPPSAAATAAPPLLSIDITGPTQATVGSDATFQVTVRNLGQTMATGLVVKDRLDLGLEHPRANAQNVIENRTLGNLTPGAYQRINLTLRVNRPGRLCQTVEVSGADIPAVSKETCLMVTGSAGPSGGQETPAGTGATTLKVTVKQANPSQQPTVGDECDFTIKVTNIGTTELRNIDVLDHWDPALLPIEASINWRFERNGLAWTIGSLSPGKSTQLIVRCKCQAAAKACNRVSVSTADDGKAEDEACVEILAAGGSSGVTPPEGARPDAARPEPSHPDTAPGPAAGTGLTMSVVSLYSPITVGKGLTYEIQVNNSDTTSYQDVTVTATVPEGMVLDPLGTVGAGPAKPHINGKTVRFDPVFQVGPNQSLVYRVRVRTQQAGVRNFHAELTSPTLSEPIVKEASTEVTEKRADQ